ncbi:MULTISPECIES: peptidase M26 [Prevotellaceae]|uniref:peptidase M26 n=1 Tax=Prevotellaceae TaxID=171552 RepID=UPI00041526FF|nr:peptidase M26 [Prevotella phocaeensis]
MIQRLSLLLLLVVSSMGAWAQGSELFKSTESPKGTKVYDLKKGPVSVHFYRCYTSKSGTIYELAKGSGVTISVPDGYRIREVVLEDTEGGSRYDKGGLDRIGKYETAPGTEYRMQFVKESGSQPDNNNIVFGNFDAPSSWIYIEGHNMSNKGQLKIRRITVHYVKVANVGFSKGQYDYYSFSGWFTPQVNSGGHTGHVSYYLNKNNIIATVLEGGKLDIKRPGTGVFTITYQANQSYAKAECSTTINVMRDRVTFTDKGLPSMLFGNYDLRRFLGETTQSGKNFQWDNPQLSITSSNPAVLRASKNDGLTFGGTIGEATITVKQEKNDRYEATSFSHTFIVVRGEQQSNTMYIGNLNEWKKFCALVNDGHNTLNAKLDADVDLGKDITMVGEGRRYGGTFDGQGHTLKMNWDGGSGNNIAPFKYMDGATIKNLRTEGQITSRDRYLSGLVVEAYGATTLTRCVSNVHLTSHYSDDACDVAGMIQCVRKDAKVTITDCLVKGTFNATTDKGKGYMGGFVCFQYGTCTLTNCLYLGTNNATGGNTFVYNSTINNCYYLNACGKTQGEQVTKEQLESGGVTARLQGDRQDLVWGQLIGTDKEPMLTTDPARRLLKIEFTYHGEVKATRGINSGKKILLPTAKEILGDDYNSQNTYEIVLPYEFVPDYPLYRNKTLAVYMIVNGYFQITTKDDWKRYYSYPSCNAKLMADLDLGTEIIPMNNLENCTFDGQGHTITVNWEVDKDYWIAPFHAVINGTIKNLRTKGSIITKENAAGLVYRAENATFSNCVSEVNISSSDDKHDSGIAGMLRSGDNTVTFNDCVVKGRLYAEHDNCRWNMAGFVRNWDEKLNLTFNNCLYIGKNNSEGTGFLRTFGRHGTVNNCYYLNTCGRAQGTQITEAQLKSGFVAYQLQAGRSDQFWGQTLGTDNEPQFTADAAKHVYQVAFSYNDKVVATRYANKGKAIHGSMPTAEEILGKAYDAEKTYTLTFDGGFSDATTVSADRTVKVTVTVPTGIDGVTTDATDVNSPVYNLRGQRMADRLDATTRRQLPAGVYIVGGRKVIVK